MKASQQLAGLSTAIGQQLPRDPTHPAGMQKLTARGNRHRVAAMIVDDFEVGAGWKPEAHRQSGEGVDALGITGSGSSNGMGIRNNPCRKGLRLPWLTSCQQGDTVIWIQSIRIGIAGLLSDLTVEIDASPRQSSLTQESRLLDYRGGAGTAAAGSGALSCCSCALIGVVVHLAAASSGFRLRIEV